MPGIGSSGLILSSSIIGKSPLCSPPTRHSQEAGIVPNGVWVYLFFDARSLGGIATRMPNHFRGNRLVAAMVPVAWKQPHAWFSL